MADEFQLHELAVEDALNGHQRAKLDRYGDIRFAVLRPARYIEATDTVEFGEVHLFIGPNFVIVIRHSGVTRASRRGATPARGCHPTCWPTDHSGGLLRQSHDQVVDE